MIINGENYVGGIQKSNPDGSLTFFCAIEEGVVLRVAKKCGPFPKHREGPRWAPRGDRPAAIRACLRLHAFHGSSWRTTWSASTPTASSFGEYTSIRLSSVLLSVKGRRSRHMPEEAGTEPDAKKLRSEVARLNKVVKALMDRSERSAGGQGSEYGLFQTAVILHEEVRARTADLEAALRENE